MKHVIIYTDGSCLGNPGPGGWAAILELAGSGHRREMSGGYRLTTNNRMEIMGAIMGLSALKEPCIVSLRTDSRYLCDSVGKGWLYGWQARNWIKANKKPVLNVDLWQRLLPLLSAHKVNLEWLAGHAGHAWNEKCDELARACAAEKGLPPDLAFEQGQQQRRG